MKGPSWLSIVTTIYPAELSKAELLIQHYCFKLQHYYDERYMSANVHHFYTYLKLCAILGHFIAIHALHTKT